MSASPSPDRLRRLRDFRVAPPGWGADSESETETEAEVPPPDVMRAFLLETAHACTPDKQAPPLSVEPAPPAFERLETLLALGKPPLLECKTQEIQPKHHENPNLPPPPVLLSQGKQAPFSRFATPLTDKEVEDARKKAIPKKTKTDTQWCMRIWNDWRYQRNKSSKETIPDILAQTPATLQRWMSRFILEMRKKRWIPISSKQHPSHCMWYYAICPTEWKTTS